MKIKFFKGDSATIDGLHSLLIQLPTGTRKTGFKLGSREQEEAYFMKDCEVIIKVKEVEKWQSHK
jgi:hypothetical protein